jgi:hypothetical protein
LREYLVHRSAPKAPTSPKPPRSFVGPGAGRRAERELAGWMWLDVAWRAGVAGRDRVRDGPDGRAGREPGGTGAGRAGCGTDRVARRDGRGAGRTGWPGGAGRGGLADGGREVLGITGHSRVCAAGYRWGRVGLDIHDAEKSFHYDMAIRGGTSYRQVLGKERAGVRLTDRRKVG